MEDFRATCSSCGTLFLEGAFTSPFICHPPSTGWCRSEVGSGAAGACGHCDDPDLYACQPGYAEADASRVSSPGRQPWSRWRIVKSSFWFVPHTQNLPLGLGNVERAEKLLTASLLQCIFYWDSTYPPQLREFFDPPVTLFNRGTHLKTDICSPELSGLVHRGTRLGIGQQHHAGGPYENANR